jgi:Fic family protein
MKPPYTITSEILALVSSISKKIGEVDAKHLIRQNPKLRKQNKIKTIHSTLGIEGNSLSEKQITALIENKRVAGPEKDILEVLNALNVYKELKQFKFKSEKDFLKAHKMLMLGLILKPGNYRNKGVGIVTGSQIKHLAPPHHNVKFLMSDLFEYLKSDSDLALIKSCVFHYEMEFIHPFLDGNGRMGRLWQTLILMSDYPLFEFLPFETLIAKNQKDYYRALSTSDKEGSSTKFIVFMLKIIDESLLLLLDNGTRKLNESDRLEIFLEQNPNTFTRKDYLKYFSDISSATASRDLKSGVEQNLIKMIGDKKTASYKKKK